jgi:hypothetical protein
MKPICPSKRITSPEEALARLTLLKSGEFGSPDV